MQKVVQLLRDSEFLKNKAYKFCLLFILMLSMFSGRLYAQDVLSTKKIDLDLKDVTLRSALMSVQKQSGLNFAFSQDFEKHSPVKVSIFQKSVTVRSAIETLLKGTNLRYVLTDDQIVIDEIPASKSPNVQAGGGPGTIKGRIVEFETSQPLPGASVYIVELQIGMQSNLDGYYAFNNIPAGKYTLQISYVSFNTEKISVEIKAGKEETYDIKMHGSNKLNEVVISGTRISRAPVTHTTEKQIVAEIKNAQSVVSGISSEQISKSADRNAAEVVRKIAGVTVRDDKFIVIRGMNERYNLTYLNGNVAPSTELYSRAFSLDLVPSRIIDRILIYKSPAPDLLADMTGGAVKIFTKDARNVKHFDIEFQTGYRGNTTFNQNFLTYRGGKFDFLGFDDRTRKLPSSVPKYGDFNKARISQSDYIKSFSSILNYGKQAAAAPVQLTANYYNRYKLAGKRLSILTSFSYKNEPLHQDVDRSQGLTYNVISKMTQESQNSQVAQLSLLQNFTCHLRDSSTLYFKNFLLQQGQNSTILTNTKTYQFLDGNGQWAQGANPSNTSTSNAPALRNIILSYSQRFLYSGNLGGQHYFGKSGKQKLEWNGGYTYSHLEIPDQRVIRLQNNLTPDRTNSASGNYEQNWVPVFRNEDPLQQVADNKLALGMISRVWIRNNESVYNASVDYTYKLKPWLTLKTGTYQQFKQRIVFRRSFTVNEGDLNSVGFPSFNPGIGNNGQYMDFNNVFFRQQDLDHVWGNIYLKDDGSGLKVYDRTSGSDAYTATEQNNSFYMAASLLPFNGKLDIYGGVRIEYNRQKVAGAIASIDAGGVNVPVIADLKATQLLPSLNIGYRPDNSFVFRAAYGKTVNRPEFRELSPYNELDYLNNQSIKGNPNLISGSIYNYDLRMEWYPNGNIKGESVSVGAFYKQLKNPIERIISNDLFSSQAANIGFQNADQATVKGLELDIRKNLDFIPGNFFRNISLIANGSYMLSKVTSNLDSLRDINKNLVKPVINRQLQGQAPYSANVGLYYENAGSGTKISIIYNQVGPRIYAASIGQPAYTSMYGKMPGDQGSLIELTRKQLDLSISQRIIKSLLAKLSVQNLFNNPVQMAEDANFTYKYEKATFSPAAPSAPGTVNRGVITGDVLSTDYKPGRFILLTFTYSL
ncbi:MAG: TonB-dependent receptor [Chitinophagaceae bacterium]